MNERVVLFPDGEDPDSFAKNSTQEELMQYLQKNQLNIVFG